MDGISYKTIIKNKRLSEFMDDYEYNEILGGYFPKSKKEANE